MPLMLRVISCSFTLQVWQWWFWGSVREGVLPASIRRYGSLVAYICYAQRQSTFFWNVGSIFHTLY